MKRRLKTGFIKTPLGSLLFGILFSFAVLLALSSLIGGILSALENPTKSIGTASMISFLLSSAVSSFAISKIKSESGSLYSFLTSLLFIFVIFIISFILSDGKISLQTLMNCLCYLLISVAFSFLGKRKTRKRAGHRRFAS